MCHRGKVKNMTIILCILRSMAWNVLQIDAYMPGHTIRRSFRDGFVLCMFVVSLKTSWDSELLAPHPPLINKKRSHPLDIGLQTTLRD